MRAHLVQLDIAWEQPEANFERVRQLLDHADPTPGDLVLLPEMFDTGFSMNTSATADRGGTIAFLAELAADLGVVVQGGRTVSACHRCAARNTASVLAPPITPGGEPRLLAEYAKIHLFSITNEHESIEAGRSITTFRWPDADGPIFCPAICYDLRFPELFRAGLLRGAEIFTLGACWLERRHAHWKPLVIARAIENQAAFLAVNRTGTDPNSRYLGGSIAVGPRGEVLGELGEAEGVLSVNIDVSDIRSCRQTFPAWRDHRLLAPAPHSPETRAQHPAS